MDARLKSWLELADELESFVEFMHRAQMVPQFSAPGGGLVFMDVGESALAKMRAAAVRPWRFDICRRWDMEGAFSAFFNAFHRMIAEGAFFGVENATGEQEMMSRLGRMASKLKELRS